MIERALSLTPPWAHVVVHCGKDIENRRPTFSHLSFRGEFFIHASAKPSRPKYTIACGVAHAMRGGWCGSSTDEAPFLRSHFAIPGYESVVTGGIVGQARIVDIIPPGKSGRMWHFEDQWGFVLEDIRPLPFAPCRGHLGFWTVPEDVIAKIEARRAA